jgi:hypothetical protein
VTLADRRASYVIFDASLGTTAALRFAQSVWSNPTGYRSSLNANDRSDDLYLRWIRQFPAESKPSFTEPPFLSRNEPKITRRKRRRGSTIPPKVRKDKKPRISDEKLSRRSVSSLRVEGSDRSRLEYLLERPTPDLNPATLCRPMALMHNARSGEHVHRVGALFRRDLMVLDGQHNPVHRIQLLGAGCARICHG